MAQRSPPRSTSSRDCSRPYGHVNTRNGTIGETQVECHLDMSFDFLLPKEDQVPGWVASDDEYFWAFLAGYMDAESHIGLRKAGVDVQPSSRSQAATSVSWVDYWQASETKGIACPDLYLRK